MKKLTCLTPVVLTAIAMLVANQASAFSVDEGSIGTPAKARLFDPDGNLPITPTANLGSSPSKDDSKDAASVRYDYDPQNGTFVPYSPPNAQ